MISPLSWLADGQSSECFLPLEMAIVKATEQEAFPLGSSSRDCPRDVSMSSSSISKVWSYKPPIVDRMSVFPQKSYVKALTHSVLVFGGGTFGW